MGQESEALLALKPVKFRYKKELDLSHLFRQQAKLRDRFGIDPDSMATDSGAGDDGQDV
jgi:hypothetical protein